tara:strand:+ start:283 stop:780 length:498 start_codon:yes stop_codon:yes gene_type:complete
MLLSIFADDLRFYAGGNLKNKLWVFLFDKSFKLLLSYRIMFYLKTTKCAFLNRYLYYRQQSKYNCYISVDAIIGKRFRIPHAFGIVIGAAVIEDNVTIFHQVTIGSHGNSTRGRSYPTIETGVKLFTGSKIIGNVRVGKNAVIGANVVINKNVQPNTIVKNLHII